MQLRGFNLAISEKAMVCLFVGLSRCVSIKAFAGLWGAARWRERQWNQETKLGGGAWSEELSRATIFLARYFLLSNSLALLPG